MLLYSTRSGQGVLTSIPDLTNLAATSSTPAGGSVCRSPLVLPSQPSLSVGTTCRYPELSAYQRLLVRDCSECSPRLFVFIFAYALLVPPPAQRLHRASPPVNSFGDNLFIFRISALIRPLLSDERIHAARTPPSRPPTSPHRGSAQCPKDLACPKPPTLDPPHATSPLFVFRLSATFNRCALSNVAVSFASQALCCCDSVPHR